MKEGRAIEYLDGLITALLLVAVVVSVWALGVVHDLSRWIMNGIGWSAFLLYLAKSYLLSKYKKSTLSRSIPSSRRRQSHAMMIWVIWLCVIGYISIHIINYRAVFDPTRMTLDYSQSCRLWLPHSYDFDKSLAQLRDYIAFFCYFWVIRDWLSNPPNSVSQKRRMGIKQGALEIGGQLYSSRFLFLTKFVVANALLVVLIGLMHRLSESEKVLWLYTPMFPNVGSYFGPFVYRGNAASYLNLVWPLGLFLIYSRFVSRRGFNRIGGDAKMLLAPLFGLLVFSPALTSSRGGLAVMILGYFLCCILSILVSKNRFRSMVWVICIFGGGVGLGLLIGQSGIERLAWFFEQLGEGKHLGRFVIYRNLLEMAGDHFLWGAGPGAFSTAYLVFRKPLTWSSYSNVTMEEWSNWAHCDPMEFFITYGAIGFLLIFGLLSLLLTFPVSNLGKSAFSLPFGFFYVGIASFLVHSIIDFPFQIYGLVFMLIVVIALMSVVLPTEKSVAGKVHREA